MRLAAPTIASTGQARMQSVQPMHAASSMCAEASGAATPKAGSGEGAGTSSSAASAAIVAVPPGAQRLIGAVPAAIASAYGRQPECAQRPHCVCGSRSSIRSASAAKLPRPSFYRRVSVAGDRALVDNKARGRTCLTTIIRAQCRAATRQQARRTNAAPCGWPSY
jgi:hypothetical protein